MLLVLSLSLSDNSVWTAFWLILPSSPQLPKGSTLLSPTQRTDGSLLWISLNTRHTLLTLIVFIDVVDNVLDATGLHRVFTTIATIKRRGEHGQIITLLAKLH